MSAKKSQRLTISGRNLQFLEQLSSDMDVSNLTEVLSYLLTDVRCLGYGIGSKPQPQSAPQSAPIGYTFYPDIFEKTTPNYDGDRNYSQDPIISRMATLIEDF